ncbi:hypothetical protein AMECASPLE_035325, partial [Ameca splendens]
SSRLFAASLSVFDAAVSVRKEMFWCLICFSVSDRNCGSTVHHNCDTLVQACETSSDVNTDIQAVTANLEVLQEGGIITETGSVLSSHTDLVPEQQPQNEQFQSMQGEPFETEPTMHWVFLQTPQPNTGSMLKQGEEVEKESSSVKDNFSSVSASTGQISPNPDCCISNESPGNIQTQSQLTESLLCCIKYKTKDEVTVSQWKVNWLFCKIVAVFWKSFHSFRF